jgi:hypothetical protein
LPATAAHDLVGQIVQYTTIACGLALPALFYFRMVNVMVRRKYQPKFLFQSFPHHYTAAAG